jgi:TolB-like protein
MSGDPEQEYFADGMVEDITTGLSRIKWLFVIARNSSFVYKGKAVDVRQVGRELGVRYVLEGGVRKAGARVRITAQLVEAETGAHLWADKFDGGLEDVFDLQDLITDRVVGIVEPSIRRSEIERHAESDRTASTLMTSICGLCRILRRFHTLTHPSRPIFCEKHSNLIQASLPPMLILRGLTTFASCTMAGSTKRTKSRGCCIRARQSRAT